MTQSGRMGTKRDAALGPRLAAKVWFDVCQVGSQFLQ
jgi:hypothetical protein